MPRSSTRCVIPLAALIIGSACGDSTGGGDVAMTGEYALARVGEVTLPIRGGTYGDGSYDELTRASLRFLSRSHFKTAATTVYRRADNTFYAEVVDSLVFEYVRKGDLLEITYRDTRGAHTDTIRVLKFGSEDALRVTSRNFTQKDIRPALIPEGLYIR